MSSHADALRKDLGIGRLFELVPDAIIVGDASNGRITLWNEGAHDLFGYTESEAMGMEMSQLVSPELREAHQLGLTRFATEGPGRLSSTREVVELPAVHRDGHTLWVELRLAPIGGVQGPKYALAVARDVTSRRAAQLQAAEQTVLAEAAAASMREFVSMASHDLRNPISGITGAIAILAGHWDTLDEDRRKHILDLAQRQTAVVLALLDDLLDVTRIEAGQLAPSPQEVDIASAVNAAIGSTGVGSGTDGPSGLTVFADPQHVQRVLVNLLSNADKYGKAPVTVEIEVLDGELMLHVDDSGAGVPASLQPRLFEKFARGDHGSSGPPGTGLGLAIVQGLVEANGGQVAYSTLEGGGARFTTSWVIGPGCELE